MIAPRPTLGAYCELFYFRDKPRLRPASRAQIGLVVGLLELWAGQEVFADDLSYEYLLAFQAWRIDSRPLPVCPKHAAEMRRSIGTTYRCPWSSCNESATYVAPVAAATANKNTRTLEALWHSAIGRGYNSQPRRKIERLPEELDNLPCFDPAELGRLLASCQRETDLFLPVPAAAFWFALILTVYDTGARISAVMNAVPADLDLSAGTITLRAAEAKGRKCQVIGLSDQTLAALRAIYDATRPYLFPWPYDRTQPGWKSLTKRFKRILRRADLPCGRIHLWHKIRRTTATQITIRLGMQAAQDHLGHSHIDVTRRYIDQTKIDDTKRNARILPRPSASIMPGDDGPRAA